MRSHEKHKTHIKLGFNPQLWCLQYCKIKLMSCCAWGLYHHRYYNFYLITPTKHSQIFSTVNSFKLQIELNFAIIKIWQQIFSLFINKIQQNIIRYIILEMKNKSPSLNILGIVLQKCKAKTLNMENSKHHQRWSN